MISGVRPMIRPFLWFTAQGLLPGRATPTFSFSTGANDGKESWPYLCGR